MKKLYVFKKTNRLKRAFRKITGGIIIFAGLLILTYFFFPLLSYNIFFGGSAIEAPIPKYSMVDNRSLTGLLTQGISRLTTDYTDARNWYPTVHASNNTSVSSYTLSIPRLKIENAQVSTTDYDLAKHLIQYAGTSIPGQNGTAIIFGHSTLPQLFDPKNYKTIFATLHLIKGGDEIITEVTGVRYTYKIFSTEITSPEDTNIFSQSFDHSYLTIVTCTPPGTVWKRLIVRATLENVEKTTGALLAGTFRY